MKKIIIVSGFFDPISWHHLKLFEEAAKLGDYLIVGLNSDECGERKKGQPSFIPFEHRAIICRNLKMVDQVCGFDDTDGTACQLIYNIYKLHKDSVDKGDIKLVFANGGDRSILTSPEEKYVEENLKGKIEMVYGVGGDTKLASSSQYLKDWVINTIKKYNYDIDKILDIKDNKY